MRSLIWYGRCSVLTTNWYQVLAIRLTDRVGKGAHSARDAMIADAVEVEQRGIALAFIAPWTTAGR